MSFLRLEDIGKSYGNLIIFKGITVDINMGDFVAVLGPSGSGKTTLLKITGLILTPTYGRMYINNIEIDNKTKENILNNLRKRYIGFSFQEPVFIDHLNVIENILIPVYMEENFEDYLVKAKNLLEKVGLSGLENEFPKRLSTGQRKRIDLIRALIKDPLVLIVDEPTANLDEKSADIIRDILEEHVEENKIVIFALHRDIKLIRRANKKLNILNYKVM